MVQRSKKDQIAAAALPLFLQQGIKGTSIDMVVKASRVSKPTVYNHFPDKSHLLVHVIDQWLSHQPAPGFRAKTVSGLEREFTRHWLSPEALRLYGLFLGEGFRAQDAASLFRQQYDDRWRLALKERAQKMGLDDQSLTHTASHQIITELGQPPIVAVGDPAETA